MSPTTQPAAFPRRGVVLGGWGVAVVLLAVLAVASAVAPSELPESSDLGPWHWGVGIVAVTVQSAVLMRVRAAPRAALLAVSAVVPVAAGAGLGDATGVTSVAVLIAAYAAVIDVRSPKPASALGAAAVLVGLGDLVRALRDEGWAAGSLVSAVVQGIGTVGIAAVAAAVVASRRETALARAGRDAALAGEQVALTQAAVARERVAMARELHDIAAHHLSGIAVMTAALDRQIDTDPEGAKTAVRQVRQQSTAMLGDLRSLVSLLREHDTTGDALDVEPESLAGIPALVETARGAGRDVELTVLGATGAMIASLPIGPLAQLAAYRTVQESLSNAARHAPGAPCEVVVDARGATEVVLEVRNGVPTATPLSGPGTGFGIVGMRERADLTDARLTVGPTPEGGWAVRLTIPVETPEGPL